MARIPTPGEIAGRFTALLEQALADPAAADMGEITRRGALLQARQVRDGLVRLVTALYRADQVVADSLATTLVELGREIAPPPPPAVDPRERALRLRQNRNTGPSGQKRAPKHLDTTARRRTR